MRAGDGRALAAGGVASLVGFAGAFAVGLGLSYGRMMRGR